MVVKLAGDDTYSVELGQLRKPRGGMLEYRVIKQLHGIYGDQLGKIVYDLFQEVAQP